MGGRRGDSRAVLSDIRHVGFKDQPESTQKVSKLRMGLKPSPDLDVVTRGGTGHRAGNGPGLPAHPHIRTHEAGIHPGLGY